METPHTELALLFDGPEPVINVFIHGYSAVSTPQQMQKLSNYILRARPTGKVYALYWKSGSWKKQMAAPIITAGLRVFRLSSLFHPAALAVDAAATVGMQSYHFKKKERLAEQLGVHLPVVLEEIPERHTLPMNLIGHSLGGRTIQSALGEHLWHDINLQDCLVMASAGDRDDPAWTDHVEKLNGHFYNAYSPNDLTLKISPDLRSRAGRHPIPVESPKIINVAFPELRHTDYWPNLPRILEEALPHFSPSEHIVIEDEPALTQPTGDSAQQPPSL